MTAETQRMGLWIVVAILLLGAVAALVWAAIRWWQGRTARFPLPEVTDEAWATARSVVARMASRAGIDHPPVTVVPRLGRPRPGWSGYLGDKGPAYSDLHSKMVTFAVPALRWLPSTALEHLVAHELGHVALHTRPRPSRLRIVVTGLIIGLVALFACAVLPSMLMAAGWPPLAATAPILLAMISPLVWFGLWARRRRRAERQADAFAIRLTGSMAGAYALDQFYAEHLPDPLALRERLPFRALLRTHPTRRARLNHMAEVLRTGDD